MRLLIRSFVFAILFCGVLSVSSAQLVTINNGFSSLDVNVDQKSGRFWFSKQGGERYTYSGGASINITSNVVFRVSRGSLVNWYTNAVDPLGNGNVRPQSSQGAIPFKPYDSLYFSPTRDTIELIYFDLFGLTVTQRFVAEAPRHQYDDGADILMEFDWKPNSLGVSGTSLGVFVMLDHDNGNIVSTVGSDNSSIITDRGYYPSYDVGAVFQNAFGQIPEYTMTGWFEYTEDINGDVQNTIFSVHRITGTSLLGAPLTTPDEFAIGRWQDFRQLSWFINGDVSSKNIQDAATAMRWENRGIRGLIRTAFGTTSKAGNNFFHCRDSNVFAVIRTERLISQNGINGPYEPSQFQVEMWVSNLHRVVERVPLIQMRTPIRSFPKNDARLSLDPSTPAAVELQLSARQTKKITWLLNVKQASADSLAEIQFLYRDTADVNKPLVPFLDDCRPLISFKSAFVPPPDDLAPIIDRTGSGRDATAWWTFRTYDRHPGFHYDSGLDRIEITRNDNNNFKLIINPEPFRRCDTTETVNLRAEVIDTTRSGRLEFTVYDCKGNSRSDVVTYSPRPDIFKPEVSRIDSLGRFDPVAYPCAVPLFEVYIEDQNNQTSSAGDLGLGAIELLSSTNFDPIEINFNDGNQPIADFDKTASFRLRVTDVLFPAEATVRIVDFAGNDDTLEFAYCTLPDVLPPVITSTPGGGATGRSWTVGAEDVREWDRGLKEVVEISNTNMRVTPWPVPITLGQPDVSNILVEVINDAESAEITLEFRDTYYDVSDPSTHAAHSDRIRFTFGGIPDTLAPNIAFRRDLSVPASEVVFNVMVNDTHFVNSSLYLYDRGLESVTWTLTSNMRVRTPISFTDNRRGATFQVEVIDPLAIVDADTVCVTAVDSAGNKTSACTSWPSTPDGKSPHFTGQLNLTSGTITGTATDNREFDRGLGTIELRNEVNIQPYVQSGLAGAPTANVALTVLDPTQPIAGELMVRDLYGEFLSGPEQAIHTVVLPFSLPVARLQISLPKLVDGEEEIVAIVVVANNFPGSEVSKLEFDVEYSSNATYVGASSGIAGVNFTAVPAGVGKLRLTAELNSSVSYKPADQLGLIRFKASKPYFSETFRFALDTLSFLSNGGQGSVVEAQAPGDPLVSSISLPPPLFKAVSDTQTVINGECNRVLTDQNGFSRPNGLAILDLYPQPVSGTTKSSLTLLVREVPESGVVMTLYSADGNVVSEWEAKSSGDHISELHMPMPTEVVPGLYFVRVESLAGESFDQVKILVE
ncbi:MAG: hypothetical protein R3F28_05750 [Candidatus Kapaibacterium sp.]